MTPPSTTPTTFAPTATTAPKSWATRRGLAPWLPARCRCGPRADLAFVLVVARNGSLQVRLRCAACGTTGERSVPHVHVHRADRVTIAKDNRPRRGLRCESCDAPRSSDHPRLRAGHDRRRLSALPHPHRRLRP